MEDNKKMTEEERGNVIGFVVGMIGAFLCLIWLVYVIDGDEAQREIALEKIETELNTEVEDMLIEQIDHSTLKVKTVEGHYIVEIEGENIKGIYEKDN